MQYQITKQAEELERLISINKEKRNNFSNGFNQSDDANWGVSYLFAKILYIAKEDTYFEIDEKKLEDIYEVYVNSGGNPIDLKEIFEKEWLRLIFGRIVFPEVIRSYLYRIEDVIGFENEIIFLHSILIEFKMGKVKKAVFKDYLEKYEKENNIKIDVEKAKETKYIEELDSEIQILKATYYIEVARNIDIFKFLKYLYDVRANNYNIRIDFEECENLINSHKTIFPNTPEINNLIEDGVLIKSEKLLSITVEFDRNTSNKIGALLWTSLVNDLTFAEDTARMRFWCYRIYQINIYVSCIGEYLDTYTTKKFIDIAYNIVISDHDITTGEKEYKKIIIDHRDNSLNNFDYGTFFKFPETDKIEAIFECLYDWNKTYQGMLYEQSARGILSMLIGQIIKNDLKYNNGKYYSSTTSLLKSKKPYIIWEVYKAIRYYRPEIIPYLLTEKEISIYSFWVLSNLSFHETNILPQIQKTAFKLIIDSLIDQNVAKDTLSNIIFHCLRLTTSEKFKINGFAQEVIDINHARDKESANLLRIEFEVYELPHTIFTEYGKQKQNLFIDYLVDIYESIKSFNSINGYSNGILEFPYVKIDLLSWVLKLRLSKKYKNQTNDSDNLPARICETILDIYQNFIGKELVEVDDFWETKKVTKIPNLFVKKELLTMIGWGAITVELYLQNKLNTLITITTFNPRSTLNKYDEFNRHVGTKLRIQLYILLSSFNSIYFDQKKLANSGVTIKNLLSVLEINIAQIISTNNIDNHQDAQIDILNDDYEKNDFDSVDNQLIPLLGIAINRFSSENKQQIIAAFIASNNLNKNLKLLDFVSSETDYQSIISLVKSINISDYFQSLYSIPNIQYVLSQLSKYQFFIEKSEEALKYWEEKITRNPRLATSEYKIFTFRIKLLHIYHKGKLHDIDLLEDPDSSVHYADFSPNHERNFYRALLSLKEGLYEDAYTIYDNLIKNSPQSPVLGLNRFAAKTDWAKNTDNVSEQKNIAQSAVDEWTAYEIAFKDVSLDFIREKITYNTLVCYELLGNETEFETLYLNLEKSIQLKQEFLQLRIENLAKRKLIEEAEKALFEAKNFHVLSDGNMPEFIDKLNSLIDIKDQLEYLQYQYSKIFSKSPKDLVQIVPDNINKSNNIPEFLLQEIINSSVNMLDYINSISEINYEDKFSDLLSLTLNSKLNFYGWHFGPTRGGFAHSLRFNPGEIDIAIYSQREKFAICEAFKLSGKDLTKTQEHCEKVFNYDPSRKCFYIIIFYEGGTLKFTADWGIYLNTIENEVLYPEPYKLISIEDISMEFDLDSIKVAKCTHNSNIPVYHIYINMNYQVTL